MPLLVNFAWGKFFALGAIKITLFSPSNTLIRLHDIFHFPKYKQLKTVNNCSQKEHKNVIQCYVTLRLTPSSSMCYLATVPIRVSRIIEWLLKALQIAEYSEFRTSRNFFGVKNVFLVSKQG